MDPEGSYLKSQKKMVFMRSKSIQVIILLFCISVLWIDLSGQCSDTPQAGLFCDPDLPDGAPLLCNLDCLDGFMDRLPVEDPMILMDQPPRLCSNGMGNQGDPNNMSWFAFIAGSETIRFRITPSNCTVEGNNLTGIQAGIYTRCYDWDDLYCIGDCQIDAFEIGGPGFIVGQTYYFFLDGCNGSVCDYRVEVIEGEQPFRLPEITGMIPNIDLENDTVCLGASLTFMLSGLTQEGIDYTYTITPPTSDYPSGRHPEESLPLTDWVFNEEGVFTLSVQATNGCDVTDVFTRNVIVSRIEDVIYDDIELCLEDISSFPGPEGWVGNNIFFPGNNRVAVDNEFGCTYFQEINVRTISLGPRTDVDLYVCTDDFPFEYEGYIISEQVTNMPLSLDNASSTGCDSLVSLTVSHLSLDAEIVIQDCVGEDVLLELAIGGRSPSGLSIDQVVWLDEQDNVIQPFDAEGVVIAIQNNGVYRAEMDISFNGIQCNQIITSGPIDINDTRPEPPQLLNWNDSFCSNDVVQTYRIAEASEEIFEYIWSYPDGLSDVMDNQSDSLVVNWGNIPGGEICVVAVSACGESIPVCMLITTLNIPEPEIDVQGIFCVDEEVIVTSIGDPQWSHNWDFQDGVVIFSNDLAGSGPHSILYSQPGNKVLSLIVNDGDCISDEITFSFTIDERLEFSTTECRATNESVEFFWEEVPGASDYEIIIVTGQQGMRDGNSFFVGGLAFEEEVIMEITALSDNPCANSLPLLVSCVAACENIEFNIESQIPQFCLGEIEEPFSLITTEVGEGIEIQYSGSGVNQQGIFDPAGLPAGSYTIEASIEIDGCNYSDFTVIEILELPVFDYEIEQPICPGESVGSITFTPEVSTDVYTYFLNDQIINEDTVFLEPGTYTVRVLNGSGCAIEEMITIISPMLFPELSFGGRFQIEEGESLHISLQYNVNDADRIDSVVWFLPLTGELCSGNVEQCSEVTWLPEAGTGDVCITVYFDGECSLVLCNSYVVSRNTLVYIPNVFSPNQDGNNDFLTIGTNDPSLLIRKVIIYDRWGSVVHRLQNINVEQELIIWDGMYSDRPAMPGVYVYLIECTNENGETLIKTGDITLIR